MVNHPEEKHHALPRQLPYVPEPYEEEVLSSWVERTALWYGSNISQFSQQNLGVLNIDKITSIDTKPSREILTCLSALLGVEVDVLRSMTIRPIRDAMKDDVIQYCAACWDEDCTQDKAPYVRRRWRSAWIVHCDKHHLPLIGHTLANPVEGNAAVWCTQPNWARQTEVPYTESDWPTLHKQEWPHGSISGPFLDELEKWRNGTSNKLSDESFVIFRNLVELVSTPFNDPPYRNQPSLVSCLNGGASLYEIFFSGQEAQNDVPLGNVETRLAKITCAINLWLELQQLTGTVHAETKEYMRNYFATHSLSAAKIIYKWPAACADRWAYYCFPTNFNHMVAQRFNYRALIAKLGQPPERHAAIDQEYTMRYHSALMARVKF